MHLTDKYLKLLDVPTKNKKIENISMFIFSVKKAKQLNITSTK